MRTPYSPQWTAAACIAGFAAGYVAMAVLSILLAGVSHGFTGLWAANIVCFVAMLRNPGLPRLPSVLGVFMGCTLANLIKGAEPSVALHFAMFATAYVLALLRIASGPLNKAREDRTGLSGFLTALVVVAGTTAALALAFGMSANVILGWPFAQGASQWFLTNLIGAALFLAPAILVTRERLRELGKANHAVRFVVWAAACSVCMAAALAIGQFPFTYAIIPLLVVAARLSLFETALIAMMSGVTAIWAATSGYAFGVSAGALSITPGFQFAVAVNIVMPFLSALLINQMSAATRRIATAEERMRMAMHDSSIGMLNIDPTGRVIETNPAFAKLLGYQVHEVEGKNVRDFRAPGADAGQGAMLAALHGDGPHHVFQKQFSRRDGTLVWVEIHASVQISHKTGEPICLVSQVQDIDARKKAEARLEEMQDRWDFALASVGQGFWDHNVDDDKVTYSSTWTSILGYDEGEIDASNNTWLSIIHPDDLPAVRAMDADHQADRIPHFEMEYRMRHKQGHWVWVLDRGKAIERNEKGAVKRMIGTLTVISERKQVEEDLERTAALLADEKERLRVTLNSIGDAVICTDADGRITFMNPIAETLTGVSASSGLGSKLHDVYLTVREHHTRNRGTDAGNPDAWHSTVLVRPDGSRRSIREVTRPIVTTSGDAAGHVTVFHDVTDMHQRQRELAHAAAHDVLTGLANRATFMAEMERLAIAPLKPDAPHQLLYIDLDGFKPVNDQSGHAAGDAMLKMVSEAITSAVRDEDLVARIGGDEFVVILQQCPPSFARLVGQNIIDRVNAIRLEWETAIHGISASIGVAGFDSAPGSADAIVANADAACYAAKAEGRGRVRMASAPGEVVVNLPRKSRPRRDVH